MFSPQRVQNLVAASEQFCYHGFSVRCLLKLLTYLRANKDPVYLIIIGLLALMQAHYLLLKALDTDRKINLH